jgi:F-type H+-transporting ATPase subunit delta
MATESGARRYASAAFEVARDDGRLDEWSFGVRQLAEVFSDQRAARFFSSSKIAETDKFRVADEVLTGVEPKVRNLAYLLIRKDRTSLAAGIAREFEALADEHEGRVQARIVTAVELGQQGQDSIRRRLEAITGKQVVMETEVDESIMGGLVARIGDRVIDGSTRSKLVALRKQLEGQPR